MRRILFSLIVAGSIATSCSSGPTPQGYFDELKKIETSADPQQQALQEDLNASLANVQSDEEGLAVVKDFLQKTLAFGRQLVDRLDALDPPAEAESAHKELVDATRDAVRQLEAILAEYDTFTSMEQVNQLFSEGSELARAGQRADEACLAVQKVADDNDIQVDLSCGPD